jgi:hypothetical protein
VGCHDDGDGCGGRGRGRTSPSPQKTIHRNQIVVPLVLDFGANVASHRAFFRETPDRLDGGMLSAATLGERWCRKGRDWRAGMEGRIRGRNRRHGLRRGRSHGDAGMARRVGRGGIAHDLRVLAQHEAARGRQAPGERPSPTRGSGHPPPDAKLDPTPWLSCFLMKTFAPESSTSKQWLRHFWPYRARANPSDALGRSTRPRMEDARTQPSKNFPRSCPSGGQALPGTLFFLCG